MTAFADQTSLLPTTKTSTEGYELMMGSELLQDFLEAALNVARVDESITDAKVAAPPLEEADAQKWHDVSLRALSWTRTALASQQDSALKLMLEQAKSRCKAAACMSGLHEIQLQTKAPVKPLMLSAEAKPFHPGPPGTWILSSMTAKEGWTEQEEPRSLRAAAAFAAAGLNEVGSLREDLNCLREYDSDRCLIVRRIKRLGLASADLLRAHFQRFGIVSEVLVAHSFERKSPKCRCDRIRPAALGFIVMETADGARAAISAGPTLEVDKVQISIKKFEAFEDDNSDREF